MPEGPEIRRAADRIEEVLCGHEAREVFFAFPRLKSSGEDLHGRTVTRVETRGKAMLTWFDDQVAVYSHNQLYGRWFVRKTGGEPKTNRQLRFAVHTAGGSALLYSASEICVLTHDEVEAHPYIAKLGPDPLNAGSRAAVLRRQLEAKEFRRRSFASLLLDQGFVAGLGNYLRSEILFDAAITPSRRPMDLTPDEAATIARSINGITRRSYRTGGITSDAARVKALKRDGATRRAYRHYVFGLAGKPCPRCGAPIVKEVLASRRLYHCSECQV